MRWRVRSAFCDAMALTPSGGRGKRRAVLAQVRAKDAIALVLGPGTEADAKKPRRQREGLLVGEAVMRDEDDEAEAGVGAVRGAKRAACALVGWPFPAARVSGGGAARVERSAAEVSEAKRRAARARHEKYGADWVAMNARRAALARYAK